MLIPFFFHDRGSSIQKTVDGLLQELLYQILNSYQDLIGFVIEHCLMPALQRFYGTAEERSKQSSHVLPEIDWPAELIEETLLVVVQQDHFTMNVCFFIDALDEHQGNHEKLVRIIHQLAKSPNSDKVNLKLCLSSRPESIFPLHFDGYPGISIQDHTRNDINTYVTTRMKDDIQLSLTREEQGNLQELSNEVEKRACGVFIWVKLVVTELLKSFSDGNNIAQLRQILHTIPPELDDLYRQIIHKIKPAYALETCIMFQVMQCHQEPLSAKTFLAIIDFALSLPYMDKPSPKDMQRRLRGRCGGLLELVSIDKRGKRSQKRSRGATLSTKEPIADEGDPDHRIQFLHQTAKAFMQDPENAYCMFWSPTEHPLKIGWAYCLEF
ncbi:MAG: hypothetical protein MMC33_008084 [Icmadophila ericetorum]|nr:hypothetical protein [Icmadophila ericetorum]